MNVSTHPCKYERIRREKAVCGESTYSIKITHRLLPSHVVNIKEEDVVHMLLMIPATNNVPVEREMDEEGMVRALRKKRRIDKGPFTKNSTKGVHA